jgi:hypothetical protein
MRVKSSKLSLFFLHFPFTLDEDKGSRVSRQGQHGKRLNGHALPYGFTFLPEAKCRPASSNALNHMPLPHVKTCQNLQKKWKIAKKQKVPLEK